MISTYVIIAFFVALSYNCIILKICISLNKTNLYVEKGEKMKKILVIDDHKRDTELLNVSLPEFDVTITPSAFEGVRMVKELMPDAVVTEIDLPYMDAYQIISLIKKEPETANIPIIVLSAEKNNVTEEKCALLGAADFIQKPFVPSILELKIKQAIEKAENESDLHSKLEKEKERSQKDPLTGLYNREYAEEEVSKLLKEKLDGVLIMIDMDNFKAINDNYGHEAGDKTLITFADALRDLSRDDYILSRLGGDEFIVFIPGAPGREAVSSFAASLIKELIKRLEDFHFDTNTSVSLGIAIAGTDGDDFTQLYEAGDRALYYVKTNGKNSYCFVHDIDEELERTKAAEDIHTIQESIIRSDNDKSHPLTPSMANFMSIYQYMARQGLVIPLILLTITGCENKQAEADAAEKISEMLSNNLRKSDVYVRYSSKQFLLMLGNMDKFNLSEVAEKICQTSIDTYGISVSYSISE